MYVGGFVKSVQASQFSLYSVLIFRIRFSSSSFRRGRTKSTGLSQPVVFILGISRDYLIRGWRTGVRECKANTVAEN